MSAISHRQEWHGWKLAISGAIVFATLLGCSGERSGRKGKASSITNSLGMEMVQVDATYYMGKYEVRQADFQEVMGSNPSHFQGALQKPVEQVTDEEALLFCEKLTELEREKGTLPHGFVYRLPTVSQWRACARDAPLRGSVTPRGRDPNPVSPKRVGSGEQNGLGIYDLRGNVQEWCRDRYNTGTLTLVGASWTTFRGEWYSLDNTSGFAWEDRKARSYTVGFRCVLERVE
jgi:formylglycine-generating enzyme required for sulfatase activity